MGTLILLPSHGVHVRMVTSSLTCMHCSLSLSFSPGFSSLVVTKCKGHTLDSDVLAGVVSEEWREFNSKADDVAEPGRKAHMPALLQYLQAAAPRHKTFLQFQFCCALHCSTIAHHVNQHYEAFVQESDPDDISAVAFGKAAMRLAMLVHGLLCGSRASMGPVPIDAALPPSPWVVFQFAFVMCVQDFLFNLSYRTAEVGAGCSWLKLYILFELHGGRVPPSAKTQLTGDLLNEPPHTSAPEALRFRF